MSQETLDKLKLLDLNFNERLTQENKWSEEDAARVIEEYKRFLYLTSLYRAPRTPSIAVDKAWHVHLLHSESYDNMCKDILGFKLHHNPGMGEEGEEERFRKQYEDTLSFYEKTFGDEPPSDIWPDTKTYLKRIDKRRPLVERITGIIYWTAGILFFGAIWQREAIPVSDVVWLSLLASFASVWLAGIVCNFIFGVPVDPLRKSSSTPHNCGGGGCGGE